MAEALAVLGAVAGSVQLLEVALKTSDDIYSLLRRAQQADQEIKQHLKTLDDMKDTLALVTEYIDRRQGQADGDPLGGIAQIPCALRTLCKELQDARDALPSAQSMQVRARFRWARRKKEFDEKMKVVETRQSNLRMLLEIVSLHDQASVGADIRNIAKNTSELKSLYIVDRPSMRQRTVENHFQSEIRRSLQRANRNTERSIAMIVQREVRAALGKIQESSQRTQTTARISESELRRIDEVFEASLPGRQVAAPLVTAEPNLTLTKTQMATTGLRDEGSSTIAQDEPWQIALKTIIGYIRIRILPTRTWEPLQRRWIRHSTIDLKWWSRLPFWPSQCIALRYTTRPMDSYYHIFPMIRSYPIISRNLEIWQLVQCENDCAALARAFQDGTATPNDQTDIGWTLLHHAVWNMNLSTCKLLLEMGADPDQATVSGLTLMRLLIDSAIFQFGMNPSLKAMEAACALLQLLIKYGGTVPRCSFFAARFLWGPMAINLSSKAISYSLTQQWSRTLRDQVPELWVDDILIVGESLLKCRHFCTVDFLLSLGMCPNSVINCACTPVAGFDSLSGSAMPIFYILLGYHRYVAISNNDYKHYHHYNDNAIRLLQAGADPYAVTRDTDFLRGISISEATPTTYATQLGIESFWKEVLHESGYSATVVYAEDERRRRQRNMRSDGMTTALEKDASVMSEQCIRLRAKNSSPIEL